MQFHFEKMDQLNAEKVASWHYGGEYAFYDFEADPEDLAELLDPDLRGESMFIVRDDAGELVGFFGFQRMENVLDLGLGLRPDLTSKGLGSSFVNAGLEFANSRFTPKVIQLRVAAFNERAIKVYKRLGFIEVESYVNRTNGGEFDFIRMELATERIQ